MLPSALLALSLIPMVSFAAEPASLPAAQLLTLERTLAQKLDERKQGLIPPDQYRQFAARFRADLDQTLAAVPQSPVNTGRHAMILARLDESGPGQALAGLNDALRALPDSAALLNAKGSIQLQQGDYTGALASADAVLKYNQDHGQPPDPDAVAVRQFSKGRGTAMQSSAPPSAAAGTNDPSRQTVEGQSTRSFQFTARSAPHRAVVPSIATEIGAPPLEPSLFERSKAWVTRKAEEQIAAGVAFTDRQLGLQPGEEAVAHKGAKYGGLVGAGVGAVLVGGAAIPPCSPGAVLGAVGLPVCVGVAGTVGGGLFGLGGAYFGGYIMVQGDRFMKYVAENGGPTIYKQNPE